MVQERKCKSLDERIQEAKRLEKVHGQLPHVGWLVKNGHSALVWMMRKHPHSFVSIEQKKCTTPKSLNEHVQEAKKLERKHNGVPNNGWLRKNRHFGLMAAMRAHPELFVTIQKHKRKPRRSIAENVALAEDLERKHGRLPNPSWLCNNNFSGLHWSMRKHPGAFAHIKQTRLRK